MIKYFFKSQIKNGHIFEKETKFSKEHSLNSYFVTVCLE